MKSNAIEATATETTTKTSRIKRWIKPTPTKVKMTVGGAVTVLALVALAVLQNSAEDKTTTETEEN